MNPFDGLTAGTLGQLATVACVIAATFLALGIAIERGHAEREAARRTALEPTEWVIDWCEGGGLFGVPDHCSGKTLLDALRLVPLVPGHGLKDLTAVGWFPNGARVVLAIASAKIQVPNGASFPTDATAEAQVEARALARVQSARATFIAPTESGEFRTPRVGGSLPNGITIRGDGKVSTVPLALGDAPGFSIRGDIAGYEQRIFRVVGGSTLNLRADGATGAP